MAVTGFVIGTAQTSDVLASTAWSSQANILINDDTEAIESITAKNTPGTGSLTTGWIKVGNFGFDSLIPANSIITKVELQYRWRVNSTAGIANRDAAWAVSGTRGTNVHELTTEPIALETITTDVTAERAWTRADLLNGVFEVHLRGLNGNSATDPSYRFAWAKVQVTYDPPTLVPDTDSSTSVESATRQGSLQKTINADSPTRYDYPSDPYPTTDTDGSTGYINYGTTHVQNGPFTWLAWIKVAAADIGTRVMCLACYQWAGLSIETDGTLKLWSPSEVAMAHSSVKITDTNWHMIAVTKSGTTTKLYIDGIDVTVADTDATLGDTSYWMTAGGGWENHTAAWSKGLLAVAGGSGRISNAAWWNGTALTAAKISGYYTFIPIAKSATDSGASYDTTIDEFTKSLLHLDGTNASTTISDSATPGHVWTPHNNAQIDTAQSKFGGASAKFGVAGDYITTPDHADFEFGAGIDFTIDFWIRPGADQSAAVAIGKRADGGTFAPFLFYFQSGVSLGMYMSSTGTNWDVTAFNPFGALSLNTWYHVAVTRSGTTYRGFLNGVQQWTFTSSAVLIDNAQPVTLGANADGSQAFIGWLDEVRITKGIARWTANFIPPTTPYSDNLFPNPSVETNMDYWENYGSTIARSSVRVHSGAWSVRVDPVADGSGLTMKGLGVGGIVWPNIPPANLIPLLPNSIYTWSVWVLSDIAGNFDVSFQQYDVNGDFIVDTIDTSYVPAGTWTRIENTLKTGASTAYTLCSVRQKTGVVNGFYADDGRFDNANLLLTKLSSSDSGTGADSATISVPISGTDTGTGADVGTAIVPVSGTDSGVGSETVTLVAKPSVTDTSTGADVGTLTAQLPQTDSGVGADTQSVTGAATPISGTDAGTGTDTATLVAQPTQTDTGVGAESITETASLTSTDAGTDVELATPGNRIMTDTGTDSELATLTSPVSVTDTSSGVDVATETAQFSVTDAGTDAEVSIPIKQVTDTGTDSEAITEAARFTDTDAGIGTDTPSLSTGGVPKSGTDSGTSSEVATVTTVIPNSDTGTGDENLGREFILTPTRGFETGNISGWGYTANNGESAVADSSVKHSGTYSAKVTTTGLSNQGLFAPLPGVDLGINMPAGTVFKFSGWVLPAAGMTIHLDHSIVYTDASNQRLFIPVVTGDGINWINVQHELRVGDGKTADSVREAFRLNGNQAAGVFYMDDMSIQLALYWANVAPADSGTGLDTAKVLIASSDSGTGTETTTSIVSSSVVDTGTGQDRATDRGIIYADVGSSIDDITRRAFILAETVITVDDITRRALVLTDTAIGIDSGTWAIVQVDFGVGTDVAIVEVLTVLHLYGAIITKAASPVGVFEKVARPDCIISRQKSANAIVRVREYV